MTIARPDLPDDPTSSNPMPPYVTTAEEAERWHLAEAIARQIFDGNEADVWMAVRSLYHGSIPTTTPADQE